MVPKIVKGIEEKTGGTIKKWGALGMCWGGKIISLTSGKGTLFSAVAEVHPAMVDPKDAEKITVPLCMLASGDEDKEAVKEFEKSLKVEHHVETFTDQVHVSQNASLLAVGSWDNVLTLISQGWMAARYARWSTSSDEGYTDLP